jgi:hypothetical protein
LLSTRGLLFYRERLDTLRLCYQQEGCFFIARDWTLCVFAINKRVAFLSPEAGHFASLLSTRVLPLYRERRGSCCTIFAVSVTYPSRMELPLFGERRDPLLFALRLILSINTSRWELPLYRERRDPLLFARRVS